MGDSYLAERRVEFRDTDAAGIAHFSVFFVWMEQAEHAALRDLGMSVVAQRDEGTISWPRVSASCDYRNPIRFEECVQIEVAIAELGTRSVTYGFQFRCGEREVATGKLTTVCCRLTDGRWSSTDIPADIRSKLESLVK